MECERLKKLIRSWYFQVQEETMAPARMATFMKQHLAGCSVCLADPAVGREIDKIIETMLPASKVRAAANPEAATIEAEEPEEETTTAGARGEGDEDEEDEDDIGDEDEEDEDDDI